MGGVILVIDDDPDQRRLIERVLTASGYRVLTAIDGQAGVAAAESHRPDLIVLDVMMPRLNGYQTCRALRQSSRTASTPILILTTKQEPADEFWATQVGANEFLTKPVDVPGLLAAVARYAGTP